MARQLTGLDRIGHFWTDYIEVEGGSGADLVAQGFFADDAAAAGQFAPVDPAAVHPVVHSGAAYASEGHGGMNG